jgi:hypothetical protein
MKTFITTLFFLYAAFGLSQTAYFVKDAITKDAIPFVKIRPNTGSPFLADINGSFLLQSEVSEIDIRMTGYRDTLISIEKIENTTIHLIPLFQNIPEVIAIAGENPAHRIMDIVIANRKKNNPLENDAFRYESYSKFTFDINREAIDSIPKETTDSTLIRIRKFFTEQYLFMLESTATRSFIPPFSDKEEITAFKVSGFSDPMFSTFANEMQSFSFYENQFELQGKTYINPIAFGGTKRYLFVLEDTTIVNLDTTFTIFFRPRKGKNFDGMTGRLYINTNGYAIEKVIASPYSDTTGIEITIIQEYAFMDSKKWFPSKLSTEISFQRITIGAGKSNLKNAFIQGKGSTYIKNTELNPPDLVKRDFKNVSVTVSEEAGTITDEIWDTLRTYSISEKEKRTYYMIDSVSKEQNLDQKLKMLSLLAQGKVPLGKVNLDLSRILNYSLYEGYRFGAGLESSKNLLKKATFGSYFGWGTRDRDWKYGAYSKIQLYKKRELNLSFRYQQDLLERGGILFQNDIFTLNSDNLYRQFFIQNMEKQRLGELVLSGNIRSNIKISLIGNYQRIQTTDGYTYTAPGDYVSVPFIQDFDLAETSLELTWNIREKILQLGENRISKGTNYPKIRFKATKGWKNWLDSELNYSRFYMEIQQEIAVRGAGKLNWKISAAQTVGEVPLFLLHAGNGTGRNWNLSVMNTFETMLPSEFYNSAQAAIFTRFTFNSLKTKADWNEPQIGIHHAMGYGQMNTKANHSISFQSMEKGYFEGGLILNNLLSANFVGFGIAAFYRYGYYSQSDWRKNIVPKITLSVNF